MALAVGKHPFGPSPTESAFSFGKVRLLASEPPCGFWRSPPNHRIHRCNGTPLPDSAFPLSATQYSP